MIHDDYHKIYTGAKRKPGLRAFPPRKFLARLGVLACLCLAPLGLVSCLQQPQDEYVLAFALDSSQIGKFSSVRVAIYDGQGPSAEAEAEPLQVEIQQPASDADEIRVTINQKVGSDFTVIVTGYDSTGAALSKTYYYQGHSSHPVPVADSLSFKRDILPITRLKCAPCHVPGTTFDFQDSTALVADGPVCLDRLRRAFGSAGRMPVTGAPNGDLTRREQEVLLTWLRNVVAPVHGFYASDLEMAPGDTLPPALTWMPDKASNRGYTLMLPGSSDRPIVDTAGGRLIAMNVGQAVVVAVSDDAHIHAQFLVTVDPPAFTSGILPITQLKCAPCHVPGQTFNFQDSTVLVNDSKNCLDRLQRPVDTIGHMPIKDAPNGDPTPRESAQLLAWLRYYGSASGNTASGAPQAKAATITPGQRLEARPYLTWSPPDTATGAAAKYFRLSLSDTALLTVVDDTALLAKHLGHAVVTVVDSASGDSAFWAVDVIHSVFTGPVQTIMQARCAACHAAMGDSTGAAADRANILDRILRSKTQTGVMPPSGPLADAELATLVSWFQEQ